MVCRCLSVALLALVLPAHAGPADLDVLLRNVTEIVAPGCGVGPVAVFGERAFPVVTGRNGRNRLPILGAARYGKGRAVLAGHEGLLGTTDRPDQRQLITNLATWLGGAHPQPVRVLVVDHRQVAPVLTAAGFRVRIAGPEQVLAALPATDVLFISGNQLGGAAHQPLRDAIEPWIRGGGGYFDGIPGWGWQQLNPSLRLAQDHGGNQLTARMGLVIADGMLEGTGKGGWLADRSGLELSHAGTALAALERQAAGADKLSKDDLAQVTHALTNAAGSLPDNDTILLPQLHTLIAGQGGAAVPLPAQPLGLNNPVARLACVLQNAELRRAPPGRHRAHAAADGFPGPVPADAPRVTKVVSVDTAVPEWHSTGLYAAPGEPVTLTIPDGAAKAGLGVRIGCHTDGLWHHDKWSRFPEISYATGLAKPVTRCDNPFGGLVYVTVPGDCKLGRLDVTIAGAVNAPLFVLGETKPAKWRDTIRSYPAPWAELATRKIILSLPASVIRNLDDPSGVMQVWDAGLDAIADLAGIPRDRPRPERIACDQQISAGYMHSGYPIMTWLDVPPRMVDRDAMKLGKDTGCWGFWHELGHNHQSGHWTFDGTGEVTCNLYSLYCYEMVNGVPVDQNAWLDPAKRNERVRKYFADGAKYGEWQADPGLALMFYAQLQQAFGWDAFKAVFAAYRKAKPEELPKNDDEKRDQWLVRFSRQVGRNLGPFYNAWGIPTSQAARDALQGLPAWLPADVQNGIPFTLP